MAGLVGAGYGAAQGLEQILEQKLREKALSDRREIELAQIEQRRQEAADAREHQRRTIELQDLALKQAEKKAEMEAAQQDTQRRAFDNMAGLGQMGLEPGQARVEAMASLGRSGVQNPQAIANAAFPEAPKPEKPQSYTYTDPKTGAKSLRTIRLEDIGPMGVDMGREPDKPSTSAKPDYQRVVVDGKETFLTPEEVRARGGVDAASRKRVATGSERQTLGFYNRMKSALADMDAVEGDLTERDIALINNSPLPDLINNKLLSSSGQQYAQALKTYTEARLRKESGAAIQKFEYENDRKAISRQVGDQPESLAQKRKTRNLTAEGIGNASGPAYEEYYGEPLQRSVVGGGGGKVMTMADAQALAKKRGVSVDEVIQRARAKGYTVQ